MDQEKSMRLTDNATASGTLDDPTVLSAILKGTVVGYLKRRTPTTDLGLDDYASRRFASYFGRFGASVRIFDPSHHSGQELVSFLTTEKPAFVFAFNGAGIGARAAGADANTSTSTYDDCRVPYICRISNPVFSRNSARSFGPGPKLRTILLHDAHELGVARRLMGVGDIVGGLRGNPLDVTANGPGAWQPADQRQHRLLVACDYVPPEEIRRQWMDHYGPLGHLLDHVLEAASPSGTQCLAETALPVLESAGLMDIRYMQVATAVLEGANLMLKMARRRQVLRQTLSTPCHYVFHGTPPALPFHSDSTFERRVPADRLADMIGNTRAYLAFNPQNMSGAFGERITEAVARGTMAICMENSAARAVFDDGEGPVFFDPDKDDLCDRLRMILEDPTVTERTHSAYTSMQRRHGVNHFVASVLRTIAAKHPWSQVGRRVLELGLTN